ncbi:hypothetical protein [Telluribacter humicola]|uniref:hypothetical protein n=1 Tax=Telluribacter humicola TaxID=1720261 RepID=UPI001A95B9AC|nr:hypothetical protein [Telluribacter humicola]
MSGQDYKNNLGEEAAIDTKRWRPEDLLLKWLKAMSWQEIAADSDDRAVEAYRAVELSVRLQDAFEAPKLRDITPRLGEETVLKLLAFAWVQNESRRRNTVESVEQLRFYAQFMLTTYPLESVKDIIYAFRRAGTAHNFPQDIMTEYLEWKSQKLEEWHRSLTNSSEPLPEWILKQCPPHWLTNKNRNEATENSNNANSADKAA